MKNLIILILLINFGTLTGQEFKHQTYFVQSKGSCEKISLNIDGKDVKEYKTINSIGYKQYSDSISTLLKERIAYLDKLEGAPTSSRPAIISSLKINQDNIDQTESIRDSFMSKYQIQRLQIVKSSVLNFGALKSKAFFDLVYDTSSTRFNTLNNSGLNISSNSGSIFTELASGNTGVIRASLGIMIANTSDDSTAVIQKEEAIQRLQTSGGNSVLKLEYPFAYLHTSQGYGTIIGRIVSKWSADFPQLGTLTENFAGSGSIGIDIYADAALSNNSLRLFGKFNYAHYFGTEEFYTNLGFENKSFKYGQVILGLIVNQNMQFSFSVKSLSSEASLKEPRILFGAQILH